MLQTYKRAIDLYTNDVKMLTYFKFRSQWWHWNDCKEVWLWNDEPGDGVISLLERWKEETWNESGNGNEESECGGWLERKETARQVRVWVSASHSREIDEKQARVLCEKRMHLLASCLQVHSIHDSIVEGMCEVALGCKREQEFIMRWGCVSSRISHIITRSLHMKRGRQAERDVLLV